MLLQRRVGLALSGGAALGAAHIGVLEVLEEHGIWPHCVAGTSAGSAVGVVYCAGLGLARIKEVATELEWGKLGRVVLPRQGFFDGSRLEEYLIQLIGDLRFDQLYIPFAVAAADILTEELVILREGRLAPAVRASCAAPAVFTPVEHQGRLLVDGGLINNLPVSAVREMGAEYVIAVDLLAPLVANRGPPKTMLEMLLVSFVTLMRNTHREAELADVVISPDVAEFSPVDLSNVPILIERGRQAAETVLPRMLDDLSGRNLAG
ncbi:MAG: patatin-like phospholipase family protein [Chloroflexi bacterium]|nr:patatin-like phospholipase family protein [Chloroflexota bacterium]